MDRSWGGGGEWWVQVLTRAIHKLDKEPNEPQSTAYVSPPHNEAEGSFSCGQLYTYSAQMLPLAASQPLN